MRITPNPKMIFRFRFVHLIALSSVIALSACQDVTAPEAEAAAPTELRLSQASTNELSTLSADLDDMTGWSLITLAQSEARTSIIGILNGLKGHLASGKIEACQDDVTKGRAWFASLSENDQVEQGNIGVTLDLIQYVLDNASQ